MEERMNKCFECEVIEDLQEHHVVPKSRGGTKTVTLCYECHMKAHGRSGKGLDHKRLTKEGLARARAAGVVLGNPRIDEARAKSNEANRRRGNETAAKYGHMIVSLRDSGLSYDKVARSMTDMGVPTPSGKPVWNGRSVQNIYKKIMEEK
jgi:hypothetical protein